MQTERTIYVRAKVSAIPATGHSARYRGGPAGKKFQWTATPIEVVVVDEPQLGATPRELSPRWWKEITEDAHLRVITGHDSGDPEVPALRAQLEDAQRQIEAARSDYQRHVELLEERERAWGKQAEAAELKFRQLTEEIERLQGQLAVKPKKGAASAA